MLANTYHLMLRPGLETLVNAGGLHRFMGWDGPILTDSGGFQVFSLGGNVRVREAGVTFRSHIDGSAQEMTPESAVGLQLGWGSDVAMALDHLVGLPADTATVRDATERTHRWLDRCVRAHGELGGIRLRGRPLWHLPGRHGPRFEARQRPALWPSLTSLAVRLVG